MADTVSFDSLLNTTTGMTAVVNNKKHDDDVVSVTGVDWFTYAGKTASTIYVSGNNFIGFGQNAEQLKIWRRDGAIYYVYRQEGTLTSGKRFLKIRVEGYVYYSSTSSSYALKYEVFLIEGQTLFINVVQRPTSSSYTGTSSITDGKTTTNLTLSVSSTVPVPILVKNAGVSQAVSYEKFVDKYVTGITVSKMPDKTTYYQGELFDATGLVVSQTYDDGTSGTITTGFEVSGFDSSSAGTKVITVTAFGKTTTFEISVSEVSITAISVTTMPSKVNYHIGKEFDSTGIVVTATASDGNTIDVTKDCTYSGFDSSSPKQCEITVHYGNFTCTFEVTIMQPERISDIFCLGKYYFVGDALDLKVSYITVEYSDGSEEVTSGYTIENKALLEAGVIPINVEYFGVAITSNVTVYSSLLIHIGSPNYEDVTAEFDIDANTLTISGTGKFTYSLSDSLEKSDISIPDSLYKRCTKMVFGDGITGIRSGFSSSFKKLESIVFSNTIVEIEGGNFSTFLGTKLEFPPLIKTIPGGIFRSCPNLTELLLPEGLQTIEGGTFGECSNLKNIVFPKSLVSLSSGAFSGVKIENIEIGNTGVSFGSSSGITIPKCKNLIVRGGTLSKSAISFLNGVLETVVLKGTVTFTDDCTFGPCSSTLKSVTLENGITVIPTSCFANCGKITEITIPASIINIGDNAFYNTSLKNLVIPDGVQTIGAQAFYGTQLTNVSIPASVASIGENAFKTSVATNITLNKKTNEIPGSPWGATGTITWLLVELSRIEVTHMPNKTTYSVGGTFDSTGLVITAYYSDSTSEQVTEYTLSNPDMSTYGIKTITVTYQEKTATFAITVSDIVSIKVKEYFGNISSFFIGDENTGQYRYAAKSLTAIYGNGEEETIPYGKFTETPVDTSKEGTYYTTVSYDGKETRNPYTVYGSPFTIATGYPDKETATATLDLSTGICAITGTGQIGTPFNSPRSFGKKVKELKINEGITGIYSFTLCSNITLLEIPSTVEELTESDLPIYGIAGILGSGYSTATIEINAKKDSIAGSPWGQTSATIVWTAKPEKLNIVSLPTKLEYEVGDVFNPDGIECNALYSNGKIYVINTGLSYEVDMTKAGPKEVTVSYTEDKKTITASFSIKILAKTAGIRIAKYPDKKYYKIGESLDITGLEVVKYREDGTESEITDYTVSELKSSESGPKSITVTYTEGTSARAKVSTYDAEFQARVTSDGTDPFIDNEDDEDSDEDERKKQINITIHWINGEFADLTNENIDQNTLTLQESICSESYFIFGGCVCNQITFQAHHDQFNGTSEEFYPSGKIEVYIERKGTRIKIFTGEIDSAERKANSLTRNFIAYDYLYKLRNTDIARWYKNQTTDKKKKLTQKQFRDKLFEFLGLEQVSTKLHWDDTYVPDTNNSNEMNVVNILKDLCLQNDRFGWMNRDGKFEYLKLRQNSYRYGQTTGNQNIYKYYNNEEVHLDTFKSFTAKEGRIWFPNIIFCDPDPNRAFGFTQGDYTAQEAYNNNVYYNRNSFFVGNEDWLNYVWNADEYGGISRAEPIMKICYGVFINQDLRKYYRAQGYTAEVQGNPLNMVGQAVELYYKKQIQHDDQEPTELQWYVHSYIMSRTLKIGATDMIDTYSANNAPFNSNSRRLGKDTPEISATVNRTRSEMPTISYAEFTDGSDSEFSPAMIDDFTDGSGGSGSTSEQLKKAQLRCVKRIKKADYDALVAAGTDRADTLYFTFEEE